MAAPKLDEASIFNAARQIQTPEARRQYIQEACGADLDLQRRVEALLRAHEDQETFLTSPTVELRSLLDASADEGPDTSIGPYRLIDRIGQGGMGTVFLAEQTQPVQRQVAVKIIRPGLDSDKVIARFEAERQALALMDHPHIAKILEAGTTPAGRPYFVMELIRGEPITPYCDGRRLTLRERLEIFISVCQAVQHAHQKGIIHRDLKPSNVLVALYDGKAVPKVIDFGIAKATGGKLTERTLSTEVGSVVGTLEYMSPEQAESGELDIDTRSDIYSLGALLYELLTGTTPLQPSLRRGTSLMGQLRIIREEDPPRPSTRLSTTEELPTIAANRGVEPKKLLGLLRGDLDWIAIKCLEKDRTRRYATANALARDLERYLNAEPVEACPPSAAYRLGKFAQRHRVGVAAGLAVAAALLLGAVVSVWQAVVASRAKQDALAAAAAEKNAKETAQAKEAEIRAVLDFVQKRIFAAARPKGQQGGLGHDVTLERALVAALPFVDKSFTEQPLVEAQLRMTLGHSFTYLGKPQIAAEQYQRARALYTEQLGPDHPNTLETLTNLASSYATLGRYDEALKLREEALARHQATLGPDHPDTLVCMNNLANSYASLGRYEAALKLHQEMLALRRAKFGPDNDYTLSSMNNVVACYYYLGRLEEAVGLCEEALKLRETKYSRDHPDTLESMANLASLYLNLRQYEKSLELHKEALTLRRVRLGPKHPDTLSSMNNLANCLRNMGRHDEALKLHEEVVAARQAEFGPDHHKTLVDMENLAFAYFAVGQHDKALKLHEQVVPRLKAQIGPSHHDTLASIWGMANLRLRDFEKAKDARGCRAMAEECEATQPTDANRLYTLACYRAVTASVFRASDKAQDSARQANAEADRAITWLKKSIAAGFKDVAHIKKDKDFDALRDRADFQELVGQLQARSSKDPK
jgi:serine/threonine protein kinase/tetratricopeptide (TPR) repeat protein